MTCEPQCQRGLFIISVTSLSTSNFIPYVNVMLLMSNVKPFNLVKEQEGNLHNMWKALLEEFEPQTEISLIGC